MLLSCPAKKVTKECGIGEALRLVAPAPEPPSPMYPTRRASPEALEHLNGQNLQPGCGLTESGGSALAALPIFLSILQDNNPSGKKSEHFLSEQDRG